MRNEVKIAGSGSYLPGEPVPFDKIEEILGDLPNAPKRVQKWISEMKPVMQEMLDVKFFHYAYEPISNAFTDDHISMAVKASLKALDAAEMKPSDIDLICYGASYQSQMPTTSVLIQEKLGIENCAEFAIHANCTSAYKAMYIATEMLRSGNYETALVVSSQVSSAILRSGYYNQEKMTREAALLRWFLCDGAGALILTTKDVKAPKITVENNYLESIGGKRAPLMYSGRGGNPTNPLEDYENALHHVSQTFQNMLGSNVFRDDKRPDKSIIFSGIKRMIDKFNIDTVPLRYLQINLPSKQTVEFILEELKDLGIDRSKLYTKLDNFGYSGPPMVFICIDNILREEPMKAGETILSFVTEVSKFMQAGFTLKAHNDLRV